MRATKTLFPLAILALSLAAGCTSYTTYRSPTAQAFRKADLSTGEVAIARRQAGEPFRVASLGAGDRLGRQIYVNDVVLASARQLNKPVTTPQADPSLLQAGVTVTDIDQ